MFPAESSSLDQVIPPEIIHDELYDLIERLARDPHVGSILEIGSSAGQGSTAAFVSGIKDNPTRPTLFCIEISKPRFHALRETYATNPQVRPYNASSVPAAAFPDESDVTTFYQQRADSSLRRYPLAQVLQWLGDDLQYVSTSSLPDRGIELIKTENRIDHFDLVLIDGSEFTGRAELDLLYGARFIVLDDIRGFKNFHNFHRLIADPRYVLRQVNFNLRNGYAFFERIYLDNPATIELESAQRVLVMRRVQPGMTVFDVGANVGDYTILLSWLVGPTGKVFAFEPATATAEKLRARLKAHECDNVTVVTSAAWSENTTLDFNEFAEEFSVWNSIGKPAMVHPVNLTDLVPLEKVERVPAIRLDDFCRDNHIDRIDFLKLDVEGAESDALQGASDLLARKAIAAIQFEISREMLAGLNRTAKQSFDLLASHGYNCFHILPDGSPGPRATDSDSYYENFLALPPPASLAVHFFTIVLNGQPFIRHHIDQFKELPFDWHWHIIEGAADLKNDTAWSLGNGGRLPPEFHNRGLSIDGTTQYLDSLQKAHPDRITLYRKPGALWAGKREMVAQPLAQIIDECLLWEIDADELWTSDQLTAGRQLFLDNPDKTAAFYYCRFFVGPDRVITTRGGYANNPSSEWLRTWRYRPGMQWAAHEPPILVEPIGNNQWRDVGRVNPFSHDDTERAGLVFQHYAYATLEQVRFKQAYYGYHDAVRGWADLQYATDLPRRLGDFLPWVTDDTQVDRKQGNVPEPLLAHALLEPFARATTAVGGSRPQPTIVIDGVFFQFLLTGIARVWWCILTEWVRSGFASHIVLLDRAGTMPQIPGIRTRLAPALDYEHLDRDRQLLQQICDEERADLFMSTYYSIPLTTPSVLLIHDMIPEMLGFDFRVPMWAQKKLALDYARRFITVSQNTKNDLLKVRPDINPDDVTVAYPGVWPNFKAATAQQIDTFRKRFNITRPYYLNVGLRSPYKNADLLFQSIARLPDPRAVQVICAGEDPVFDPKYQQFLQQGILQNIGRVDDATLATAYSGAAALVYPSLYEGFGLPIVEAFACGCPVITAATSAIPEVAGEAAVYVDPHDPTACAAAMQQVLQPEIRQRLITSGLDRVKRYRWDTMAQTIRDVLLRAEMTNARMSQ